MLQTKVLIVDDEMDFASTLAERLQMRGYNAKSVFCAEDAIALSRNDPPDVMLLDLRMPGMNGSQALKTIKQFNPSIHPGHYADRAWRLPGKHRRDGERGVRLHHEARGYRESC